MFMETLWRSCRIAWDEGTLSLWLFLHCGFVFHFYYLMSSQNQWRKGRRRTYRQIIHWLRPIRVGLRISSVDNIITLRVGNYDCGFFD